MKQLLKFEAKKIGITAGEIAVVGTAMIITKKFLDFNTLFKNKIAADPTFADKWFIKHQGAIRFGLGLAAASYIKNPWLKLAMLGIAAEGFITEVRVLTTDAAGTSFFDKIGNNNGMLPPADDELLKLAAQYDNQLSGPENPVYQYGSTVAYTDPTQEYTTTVAGAGTVDLTESIPMSVAGGGWGDEAVDTKWW